MDNVLKYKNFIGTVNFSAEDGVFYGKIEGIKSMVSFEGETVKDLEKDFKDAVNNYLDYCKRHNIETKKSYSGKLSITITPDEHSLIAAIAKNKGISIAAFIKNAINRELTYQ